MVGVEIKVLCWRWSGWFRLGNRREWELWLKLLHLLDGNLSKLGFKQLMLCLKLLHLLDEELIELGE